MRNGILTRELLWATPSGKHVRVRSTRLVSFEHRHVMAVSYEVTLDRPAPVVIRSRVRQPVERRARRFGRTAPRTIRASPGGWVGRILEPRLVEHDGEPAGARLPDRRERDDARDRRGPCRSTCRAITTSRCTPTPTRRSSFSRSTPSPTSRIRLVKYAAYQTSRSVDAPELVERCRRTLDRVVGAGFESLVTAQRSNLDRFWERADVTLEDTVRHPVRMQQAVRWNLFHLAQATWRAEGAGIPAKGLTGDAYDGHYFWDTETWVLPFLAYTQPRIARNLLRFRHSMLDKARRSRPRARICGVRLFPWRTIDGDEASAYHLAGTAQFHLNADIAYAIRRYVDVRGDTDFLVEIGAEILVETARMWMDLGFFGDDGCFHIHGVTGPDEYTAMVDDNAYTNLMARLNLHYAAAAVRRLRAEQPEDVRRPPGRADARPVRARRLGSSRRAHVRPTRRQPRDHPAGRHVPHARALGPRPHAAGRSSRCSCTTTRSRCTGARCSSRPTW